MLPEDRARVEQLRQVTGERVGLKEWERITKFLMNDQMILMQIETYDVQVLVREDRYNKKGTRVLIFELMGGRWHLENDVTMWDEDFVPYVYEKIGRRKTADELNEQREWEKLCYRPGSKRNPLDSYDRVTDPFIRSTNKMERHF